VAGVAVHPLTGVLYALVAPHEAGGGFALVTVDRMTGAVWHVGDTGLSNAAGLAIRPTDGSLWTWAKGSGPATIDMDTGASQIVASSNAVVTDIAWRPDGAILFAVGGRVLWSWNPEVNRIAERSKLPVTAAAVAMRADGRLLLPGERPESGLSLDSPPGLERGFSLLILDPKTGVVDATLAAEPVPISMLPAVAAARIESLTWPISCGNPSPGGPADLIQSVAVDPLTVCPGGSVQVTVETIHPEGGASPVNVTVAGLPGADRWVQFEGLPGPRLISVAASTAEGYYDGESVQAEVIQCDPSVVLPIVRIRQDPYHAGLVDLEVQNADVAAPPGSTFSWEFGDGTTAEGTVPFVRHSYAAVTPRDVEFPTFDAAVTVTPPNGPSSRATKTVSLWNRYAADVRRGLIRPPIATDETPSSSSPQLPSVQSITPASAPYTLHNIEDRSITLTGRQIEHQFCNPDLDPLFSPWEELNIEVEPGASLTQRVVLPADEEICGVGVHLVGTADLLHKVAADVYFDTRRNTFMQTRVSDAATLAALNAAAPLLSNPDQISEESLFQLSRELRIPMPGGGAYVPPPEFDPDPYVGKECDPGETPPYEGITCQATPNEWKSVPAHIRNALKGDVIVGTACGLIGDLLREVVPAQYYSHSGIMTSNYYSLVHSTASSDRYLAYPEGGGSMTNGIREDVLKYGWPGIKEYPVGLAFKTVHETDPSGASFELHGFSQNPVQCPKDEVVTYPIVIRPPADQADLVRPMLKDAADIAKNTQPGNYRLYAYTDTGITLATYDNNYWHDGPATMCSGFVWRSLRQAGVQFEGSALEPEDSVGQASLDADGLLDGLYAYDEAERLKAGTFIHDSITEQVYIQAGWFGDAVTDAADDLANQFTNCFNSDWCGGGSKDSEAWRNPGIGRAVSPEDMLFWDSPERGGAFGYNEPLVYRSGDDHVRVYRWARSEGAGDVRGTVMRGTDTVQDARVLLRSGEERETMSGPDGSFSFLGVPAGVYEIVAQLQDGEHLLEATESVAIPANGTATVTLTLELPPEYLRRLTFHGTYHIVDSEPPWEDDEIEDGAFLEMCNVDPFSPTDEIHWERCVGGEVVVKLDIYCALMPDEATVAWNTRGYLYEQTDCDPSDLDGSMSHDGLWIAPDLDPWLYEIHMQNDDDGEPDGFDEATFLLWVTNWLQP